LLSPCLGGINHALECLVCNSPENMSNQMRLEPQPPDLQPPWRTATRVELQIEARDFTRDIVLPIADELDRQKAEMPRSLIDQMAGKGWLATMASSLGTSNSIACVFRKMIALRVTTATKGPTRIRGDLPPSSAA
jgi:hypothetical protein